MMLQLYTDKEHPVVWGPVTKEECRAILLALGWKGHSANESVNEWFPASPSDVSNPSETPNSSTRCEHEVHGTDCFKCHPTPAQDDDAPVSFRCSKPGCASCECADDCLTHNGRDCTCGRLAMRQTQNECEHFWGASMCLLCIAQRPAETQQERAEDPVYKAAVAAVPNYEPGTHPRYYTSADARQLWVNGVFWEKARSCKESKP